ncbi:hypothetical protein HN937_20185 [Candidatus Poribacteria bacterium]|nr:hypothetical protein [Candidatus Poribacteria bacterium]
MNPIVTVAEAAAVLLATLPVALSGSQMESFAARWGVPMLLVFLIVAYGIGAAKRREAREARRERDREARDEQRELRMLGGFEKQAEATGRLERAVDRQTSAVLATTTADPDRIDDLVQRLTASDRFCGTCVLADVSGAERLALVSRIRACREHHGECVVARAIEVRQTTGGA